jgi:S-adenosylmethionine uptake transporter
MTNTHLRGALFALAAMALYCLYDVTIKFFGPSYSPLQVLFCAGLVFVPLIGVQLRLSRQGGLRPVFPRLTAVRVVISLLNATIGAYAFSVLPLAECYAVFFLMPLMIAALAVPVLGEPMDLPRSLAIAAGFGGVLVALQPGVDTELGLGHLAAFVAAALGAVNYVILRKVGGVESPGVLMLYPAAAQLLALAAVVPTVWVPMPVEHWALTSLMGLELFGGGFLIILAYRHAPAIIIAPMQYSQIIWAAAFGWLMFDEAMPPAMIAGVTVIIGAGLFILGRSGSPKTVRAATRPAN